MNKKESYLNAIFDFYPELEIHQAHFHNRDGQYNDVLVVNEEIVFRFPRYPPGVASIQNEIRILNRIRGCTSLSIPDPIYTSQDQDAPGKVFMGYRMIPGEPLWRDRLHGIDDEELLQSLAEQLAQFLKELHSIPREKLGDDIAIHDPVAEMAQLYGDIREHLFFFMRPDARQWAADHFEAYLDSLHLHDYPQALTHGDFGGSNILYLPRTQTISGIIDFGFAGIGDPADDIAAVSTFGEAFLGRFLSIYPDIEAMLERASYYKATFALFEAVHGFKTGDEAAFQAGIEKYV